MRISRRTSLVLLLLGLFLFAGILFRAAILDNFVTPVALVVWLFRRIVLSVDQRIYWIGLIFSAALIGILRLVGRPAPLEREAAPRSNATLETVSYWRTSILITRDEIDEYNLLRRELGKLLTAVVASRRPDIPQWEILTQLRSGQIPLPEDLRAFLFPEEDSGAGRSFRQRLQTLLQAPRKWARRWRGSDRAGYYQSIEDVIRLMESELENPYDDNERNNHPH